MRPTKLTFQAFGPFLKKVSIDFNQFSHEGLFLITGQTGSGKTSLFDALYYALYGMLSNSEKDTIKQSIKSHFATEEDLCFVELEFIANNKSYKIYREPEQEIIGKSNRKVNSKAKAQLSGENLFLEKINEVNSKINELIGLDASQFKQIVLLPQGAFQKLLFASSTDKESIFRDIFQTEQIRAFTQNIKEHYDVLYQQYILNQTQLITIGNTLSEEDEYLLSHQYDEFESRIIQLHSDLKVKLESDYNQLSAFDKQLQKINTQISLQEEQQKYREQLNQLHQQKEEIDLITNEINENKVLLNLLPQVQTKNRLKMKIDRLYSEVKDIESQKIQKIKEIEVNKKKFEVIKTDYQQLELLKNRQTQYQQQLKTFEEINQFLTQINEVSKQVQILEKQINKHQHDEVALSQRLSLIEQTNHEIIELNTNIQKNEYSHQQFNTKLLEIKKRLENRVELEKKTVQHQIQSQKTMEIDAQVSRAQISLQQQMAGYLASNLKENQACPVCGSLDHPVKAQLQEGTISQEELQKLQVQQQANHKLLGELTASIQSIKDSLGNIEHLDQEHQDTQRAIEKIREELTQQLEVRNSKKELVSEKKSIEEKLKQVKEDLNSKIKNMNLYQGELNQSNLQKEKLENSVKDISFDQLHQQSIELSKQISIIQKIYDDSKDKLNQLNQDLVQLNTQLELQQKSLVSSEKEFHELSTQLATLLKSKGLVEHDFNREISEESILKQEQVVNEYVQAFQKVQTLFNQNRDKLNEIVPLVENVLTEKFEVQQKQKELNESVRKDQSQSDNLAISLNQFIDYKEKLKLTKSQLDIISPIKDVASGYRGNNYLSFERYVLSAYFDEVVSFANERLWSMSQGRYQFVISSDKQGRALSTGLDLEVFDHYTSRNRSVKTLSGGETFNASLSLALGLSDVISSRSGGIVIETLFVDEGFGTLDSTTLDIAIETLFNLHQSGRLVGIISHVNELKERIENQIQVIKSSQGSVVQVIN